LAQSLNKKQVQNFSGCAVAGASSEVVAATEDSTCSVALSTFNVDSVDDALTPVPALELAAAATAFFSRNFAEFNSGRLNDEL
jgi:hypothetical protein